MPKTTPAPLAPPQALSTAVVPLSEDAAKVAVENAAPYNPYDITQGPAGPGVWTSLELGNWVGKQKAMQALSGTQKRLTDALNTPLRLTDVLLHGVDITTEDGEIVEAARVVLFTEDGESYQAVSEGLVKSLRFLSALVGKPPWKPAVAVIPRQIETKRGRRYFVLDLANQPNK